MSVTIRNNTKIRVVGGRNVEITGPRVSDINTDDIFNVNNPEQSVTEQLRGVSEELLLATIIMDCTHASIIPLYHPASDVTAYITLIEFVLTRIDGHGTTPIINVGFTENYQDIIDGTNNPSLFTSPYVINRIGQILPISNFSSIGGNFGADYTYMNYYDTLTAKVMVPATYGVYTLKCNIFGFTAGPTPRVIRTNIHGMRSLTLVGEFVTGRAGIFNSTLGYINLPSLFSTALTHTTQASTDHHLIGESTTANTGSMVFNISRTSNLAGLAATGQIDNMTVDIPNIMLGQNALSQYGGFTDNLSTPINGLAANTFNHPFIIYNSSSVTINLVGLSTNSHIGNFTFIVESDVHLTGLAATSHNHTTAISATKNIGSLFSTSQTGSTTRSSSRNMTGQSATSGFGTISKTENKNLTGQLATSHAGTLTHTSMKNLTGQISTSHVGTLTHLATQNVNLTGNHATISMGTLVHTISKNLIGEAVTTHVGSLSHSLSKNLTGDVATSHAGTITVTIGTIEFVIGTGGTGDVLGTGGTGDVLGAV
jgi:hypothetical protein